MNRFRFLLLLALLPWYISCGKAAHPVNAILVVADTVRADHLGLYGYRRHTSKELDRWSGEGLVFEHAFATSPWTLPSFASIYTGQIPSRHSAGLLLPNSKTQVYPLEASVRTVAEILKAGGYQTAAVVNNPLLSPEFGLNRGFQVYDY